MLGAMTLILRRALALFFVGLFVIVALAALAYARGYRFDPVTKRITQTGVILLHGEPKKVRVSLDNQVPRPVNLPRAFRGIAPGAHTVTVSAPGYGTQKLSLAVTRGQTTTFPNLRLIQTEPLVTVRAGLPANSQLAPDGSTVAWQDGSQLQLATPESSTTSPVIPNLAKFKWQANELVGLDSTGKILGLLSSTGQYRAGAVPTQTDESALQTLAAEAKVRYLTAQRVNPLTAWLLTNEEGAWFLEDDGTVTLVSRWVSQPLAALEIGSNVLAIVRPDEITLRNFGNNQTFSFPLAGIVRVASAPHAGVLDLLVEDGDVLRWVRASFF